MVQKAGKRPMSTIVDGNTAGSEGDNKRVNVQWGYDNTYYRVVYSGSDGVNVRSLPNGHILATAYSQSLTPFKYLLSGNKDWKKFNITGWMVEGSNKKKYLTVNLNNIATIIWDGDGNPRDNFVNLRASTNFKADNIVARVYMNTSVRVIGRKNVNNRKWLKIELIGWMRVKTAKSQLLDLAN